MRKPAARTAAQHRQLMSDQRLKTSGKAVISPVALRDDECTALLASVIASQALEGVHISREDAARLLDEALFAPLPDLG